MTRTLRLAIESDYVMRFTPEHTSWPRLARHAAWLVEHYHVKGNGRTAHLDAVGSDYKGIIVPFGETIPGAWRTSLC